MKVTVLGCGTSAGVPRLGNDFGLCDPANPKNRRRRVSVLVECEDTRILVDCGPDMREQLLSANVAAVDGVLITHDHADHTHGIDDLRGIYHNLGRRVDVYASEGTWEVLTPRFRYLAEGGGGYPAIIEARIMPDALQIGPITVRPFRQMHGVIDSLGFRFEADGAAFAYSTDVHAFPRDAEPYLDGLDLWIVDALRRKPHPSHAHLSRALEWVARWSPRRALITHMDSTMDYDTLRAELPAPVEPAFDGQTIELLR